VNCLFPRAGEASIFMARIRHLVLLSLTALSIAAEETQWSTVRVKGDGRGDGHAHVIGDVGTATVTVSQASQDAVHDRVHHVHHVTYSDDPPEHLHEYVVHDRVHHVHHVTYSDDPPEHRHEYATYADRVPGEAKPDWSHVYLSQQHLDPSKVPAEWMDDTGKDTQIIHDHHIIFDDLPAVHHVQHIVHHHYDQAQAPAPKYTCDGRETQFDDCPDQTRCVACTPVDCLFTEWSRWYDGAGCIGLRFRHRSIQVRNNECGLLWIQDGIRALGRAEARMLEEAAGLRVFLVEPVERLQEPSGSGDTGTSHRPRATSQRRALQGQQQGDATLWWSRADALHLVGLARVDTLQCDLR